MARYVRIENGAVINATNFDDTMPNGWDAPNHWVQSDDAHIGWGYDGQSFVAPVQPAVQPPAPVMDPIAARLAALEAVLFAGKPVTDANLDNTQKQLTSADVAAINAPPA